MDENKNIPPEQPPDNIPKEIISSEQKLMPEPEEQHSTINPVRTAIQPSGLQHSDMEIHHHGHVHEKKKWKEYVFQFFMLFLAVFCGFLAEYQLEHKIEKERGRQYILSLYEDLKNDTSEFTNLIQSYHIKVTAFEGIDECFETVSKDIESSSCLANLFSHSNFFNDLVYSDGTLQQLKNAGGLRLLKNDEADSILVYDNMLRTYTKSEITGLQETQTALRTIISTMTNHKVYTNQSESKASSFLYIENGEMINRYFNLMEVYAFSCERNLERMIAIKNKAISLIEFLKKEYSLK